MNLINPVVVDDDILVSSTVAEDDAAVWASGTTYATGAVVMYQHRLWKSLADANVGNAPPTSPTKWIATGPTNRYAMFDRAVGTQTVAGTELTVVLEPGPIDSLAFLETDAVSAHIVMVSNTTTVYDKTISFENGGKAITDWWQYFFGPIGRKRTLVILDLPIYNAGVLTVTINHETQVRVGVLLMGQRFRLGDTLGKASLGTLDYSRKETNEFGVTDVVERPFSKRASVQVKVIGAFVDEVLEKIAEVRAKPSLWLGDGPYDSLKIYGFAKSHDLTVEYVDFSMLDLQIEGLI